MSQPATTARISKERRRRARGRGGETLSLNLISMIDIVFLLLIFFMLQMRFHRLEGILPIKLPKTQGLTASREVPMSPLRVTVRQVGDGPTDYVVSIDQMAPPLPQNFIDLYVRLRQVQETEGYSAETPVVIAPQGEVKWDHVINAYNAAVRARFTRIHFAASG